MSKKTKKKSKPEKAEKPTLRLQNKHPPLAVQLRYDAAQTTIENSKHWALADSLSADAANTPEVRRTLRNRARYEVASNSYARGMVLTLAATCIGTGPRLQLLSEEEEFNSLVETEFIAWSEAVRLCEKLQTLRMAKITDGEAFAAILKNPKLNYPVEIDLRPIEADRITTPYPSITNEIEGIEYDKFGNPIQYHVSSEHPGDSSLWYGKFEKIPAEYMIHWYRIDRPGQSRGLPEIMAALPLFAQLRRYTLAVLAAAETAADFAAVLYTDAPANGEAQPLEAMDVVELEKRMATVLADGWKLGQIKAEHPNTTYSEFKREILGEIGRCLQVPINILLGDSSRHNYASGRLDHQTFFKSIKVEQSICEQIVLYPLFKTWYREASRIGIFGRKSSPQNLMIPTFSWYWDGQEHVDPMKEAKAAAARIASMTSNIAIECAKVGLDWEDVLEQASREKKRMAELGLDAPTFDFNKNDTTEDEDEENETDEVDARTEPDPPRRAKRK